MAWTTPSVKVCMWVVSVGGKAEVIGALLVRERWTVIERGDLGGIQQVEALGPLRGGTGRWSHESSPNRGAGTVRAARAVRRAGIPNKRTFVWYAMHVPRWCRCHPLQARKLYHTTHLQNQCTTPVDTHPVSWYIRSGITFMEARESC